MLQRLLQINTLLICFLIISCNNSGSNETVTSCVKNNSISANIATAGNCYDKTDTSTGNSALRYAKYYTLSGNTASSIIDSKSNTLDSAESQLSQGVKTLVIKNSWNGEDKNDVYTLVPRDCTALLGSNINAIPYPVKSVVCMSSSHVAYLSELGKEECIKGISGTRFISNEKVRKLIANGKIADVGGENTPNYELIMAMKPDVVIAYGISGSNNSHIEKLQKFRIKVLTIGDYLENSPLGKLEYLKLFGELTGCKELADSLFTSKEQQYLSIKQMIAQALGREDNQNNATAPNNNNAKENSSSDAAEATVTDTTDVTAASITKRRDTKANNTKRRATKVLLNAPYKGVWYVPGSENYTAQLIQDAGGEILGAKEGGANSAQLSFEQVYQYALQAEVWLHPNSINSLSELAAEHPLFKNIPALKNGKVYNNTLRNTPQGGSDFWETGVVEPHIILQDLARILNPHILNPEILNSQDINPQFLTPAQPFKYYLQLK